LKRSLVLDEVLKMKTLSVFFQGNQMESSSLYAYGIVEHVSLTDYQCAISNSVT